MTTTVPSTIIPMSRSLFSAERVAAQPVFFLSEATGNKNATGDQAHPIPRAEWSKRTGGITPSVAIPWVQILDGDASPLQVTYARIPSTSMLWISGRPAVVGGTVTTVTSVRAESVSTRTPRAVIANALTSATYAGPSGYRLRSPSRGTRAWPTSHTLLEAAHTFTIHPPYAPLTPAVQVVRPLNAREFVGGDTLQVETLPLVGELQILGTQLDSNPPGWNLANPSYATNDSCRILVQDLEIGGAPPKSDYSVTPQCTTRLLHPGQGQVWYDGCGVESVELTDGFSSWWGCRVDQLVMNGGAHQFYGGSFTFGFNMQGGFMTLGDVYFDAIDIFGYGGNIQTSGEGGSPVTIAFMDALFGTYIDLQNYMASVVINSATYGTGAPVAVTCVNGARVYANGNLANLLASVSCVSADGVTNGPNTTGTFLYGVNTSATPTGAGVYNA